MADAPPQQSASLPVNFWTKALALVVVGLLLVYLLWWPLGLPARLLNMATKGIGPSECSTLTTGTSAMKTCATTVGVKKVVGPLIVGLVMFVLRKQIGKGMKRLEASKALAGLPILRPIVPAVTAIVLFTMGWAAIHDATKGSPGLPLFNQQRFPVLVGLFTLASSQFGPAVMKAGAGFFHGRDRFKLGLRIVFVTIVSIVVSYLVMTRSGGSTSYLTNPGLKEQSIVVFSLVLGWLMLTPVPKPGAGPGAPPAAAPAGWAAPVPPPPGALRR